MKPHIHAELIKAWADGAQIQYQQFENWVDVKHPSWCDYFNYRIKPDPDIIIEQFHYKGEFEDVIYSALPMESRANQRVLWIIDGETRRIKSVELLDK